MKVLAISTSCFTASNRVFYRRLQANGIDISLVIPDSWDFGKGPVKPEPKKENDPALYFLTPTKYHHRLFKLIGTTELIDKVKPDVVYFEGDPGSIMSALLGKYCTSKKIKLFALSCENLSQNPIAVIKREGFSQIAHALIKYSLIQYTKSKIDTLFVINNQGFNYFKKLGFKNVVKTPLGFNENVFKLDPAQRKLIREKLKIDDDTVVISYFGRLVPEKGVHLLIKALDQVQNKNWVFLIDEFSRYKTDYQAKIEGLIEQSNFKEKTIFFEANHTEIANYMNASDIAILPSIPTKKWIEQYGRVVPEAMACGNRLIISNEGAQQDFFESDYEFKYPPLDENALTQLIEKAIKESQQNRLDRSKFVISAHQNFSLNAQIKCFKSALNI